MPRKLREQEEGAFHHVYARGNRKGDVFLDDEDRRWFLERLLRIEGETSCLHVAHCLMSNHLHLLIRPGEKGVSRLLQRVLGPYSQWFNRRHGLVGHLFQGRFGSRLIDSESDLLWILRYIHRNPVVAGMVPTPEAWRWSSHTDHLRENPPAYIRQGVALSRRLLAADPGRALVLYRRLMERPDGDYLHPLASESEGTAADDSPGWSPARPTLEGIAGTVESRYGIAPGSLRRHGRSVEERNARRAFCRSATTTWGFTLAEVSACLGRSESVISALARSSEAMGSDPRPKGSDPVF